MSVEVSGPPVRSPDDPGSDGAAVAAWWRRHRTTALIGVGVVVAVAVVAVFGGGASTGADLDPANPGANGTRALARVLDDQGVDLEIVRSAEAFEDADVDASTTVVVTSADDLGRSTAQRLLDHAAPGRLIVVDAGPGATGALGLQVDPRSISLQEGRTGACEDPLLDELRIQADDAIVYRGRGCFAGDDGAIAPTAFGGTQLFGGGEALTNDQILRADNAAIALRLLGQEPHLVWYVPSIRDLSGSDGVGLRSLIPPWILPGLLVALFAIIGLIVWRGRRLGALATEPLPVVVRAIETTQSLGRLYRRSGDRSHAADTMRRAALARAREHLRLGASATPDQVIEAVSAHGQRRRDEVSALLLPGGPAPTTDAQLVDLAHQLFELDREVRRP